MKKLLTLSMIFAFASAFPQTRTCSCGSQAGGKTIEFQIIDPGPSRAVDCCKDRAVGTLNAYAFTWESAGRNTYVLVETSTYATSADAQADCCPQAS